MTKQVSIPKSKLSQAMNVFRNIITTFLLPTCGKNILVGPYNVGIEINHALSNCNVQCTNKEQKQESSRSKENDKCKIMIGLTEDTV